MSTGWNSSPDKVTIVSHIQDIIRELATQDDIHPVLMTIDSGCTAIQHLAIRRLEALCNRDPVLIRSLQQEILQAPTARRLNAICSLNRRLWSEPILSHMLPKLKQYGPVIQKSMARLACRQFPEQVHDLIQNSTKPVARVLCFHAIRGDIHNTDLHLLRAKLLAFDTTGLSEVLTNITDLENANADDNRWMDIETISRSVFALQIGAASELLRLSDGRTIAELLPDDPADGELIVWGVMLAEREDLRARELPPAWRFPDLLDELDGLCQFIHLPASLRNQRCLEAPRIEAEKLEVPANLLTEFLLESAASELLSEDQRLEVEVFRMARWRAMNVTKNWSPRQFDVRISQSGQRRLPEALNLIQHKVLKTKQGCLDAASIRQSEDRCPSISPCAKAAIRISKTANPEAAPSNASRLVEAETFWSERLTPIGIEIQIPRVNRAEFAGWLEFYRSHGIPTPRRPECGYLFELAVPPAVSWHAPEEILKSVLAFRVPLPDQDLSIHVSLQGELKEAAGTLAFTQLFLNSSTAKTPRVPSALRHVMSKGLVFRNTDVVQCHWSGRASCRTEFRVITLPVTESLCSEQEVRRVCSSIRELQLLGSAAISPAPQTRQIFNDFRNDLQCLVAEFPRCLHDLLNADFYESTGDFQAVSLIDRLEILKRRDAVRQGLPPHARLRLVEQLKLLRSRCADRLEQHWNDEHL